MRSRNIKPGFFKNEELVKLPVETRLLFIGLWCLADRKGRLEDRPVRIKMEIFPGDVFDVSTMLEQLKNSAFILRYESKSNRYIQIVNFEKHQYPHIKEADSTIPAPYKHGAKTILAPPDILNPSSLNPDVLNPDITEPGASKVSEWFEKIWTEYPQKGRVGRKMAFRHFVSSVKTLEDAKRCAGSLDRYLDSKRVKEGFIQNATTWFNNWQDWEHYTEAKDGTVNS